jgi:hypothetical protein
MIKMFINNHNFLISLYHLFKILIFWTIFVYIWVCFVGFLIFSRLFSKMKWKTSKKGPLFFNLKCVKSTDYGLFWLNSVSFLIFSRLFSKKEVKNVKKGPIVFQLEMRQKHWCWVILGLPAWFFDLLSDFLKK